MTHSLGGELSPSASSLYPTSMYVVWTYTHLCILVYYSSPCSIFDTLVSSSSYTRRGGFFWGPLFLWSSFTTLWNVSTASSILLYNIWNLKIFWSRLPGLHYLPEWFHWVSLSVIYVDLRGLPPLVTHPKNYPIISWGQWGPDTCQFLSNM